MKNLVPLGTGNSRLMKSNIPSNTTLAQIIQMWNNGTFPYDIGPLNSAGISQQGTPLNKATLLKDATAALFGLGTDAVPDDVLSYLGKYNLCWWKRRGVSGRWEISEIPMTDEYLFVTMLNQDSGTVQYSNGATVDNSGNISLDSPVSSIDITNTGGADALVSKVSPCLGHYCAVKTVEGKITHKYPCVFLPSDANLTHDDSGWTVYTDKYTKVEAVYTEDFGEWEYVQSSNRSAYPDSGEQDGYEYEYLGVPFEILPEAPKVSFGNYTGNGKSGASNKNILRLPFPAKIVIINKLPTQMASDYCLAMFIKQSDAEEKNFISLRIFTSSSGITTGKCTVTFDSANSLVKWYSDGADSQLNINKELYTYVCFG